MAPAQQPFHAPTRYTPSLPVYFRVGLLLRPAADVEVVHPHVHRLGDGIADPAPNRHPADLRPAPCFGLGARAIEHVPVLAHLYAVDPPVRLTVRLIARVRDQHHLPTMPLTARQRDGGEVGCEIARGHRRVLQAELRLERPAATALLREVHDRIVMLPHEPDPVAL